MELTPKYLPNPKMLVCPLSGFSVAVGYEYYGGKDSDPPSAVLLVSKAQRRKVKTGPRVDKLWILEEGVKPGDKVIVEGAQKVRDGMLVKAEPAPPEPASPPSQAGPVPAAASIGAAPKAESSSR